MMTQNITNKLKQRTKRMRETQDCSYHIDGIMMELYILRERERDDWWRRSEKKSGIKSEKK